MTSRSHAETAMDSHDTSFLREVPGVVHVGANTGQERDIYRDLGLHVVWIEPITEVFKELVGNIRDCRKQRAFCALLAEQDAVEYQFHIANNGGASSSIFQLAQHRDIWPDVDFVNDRLLLSSRLDTLFRREGLMPAKYPALVMDVQGAELMVLKGAGQMLREFHFVQAEAADFESYAGSCTLEDLHQYLEPFGFREIGRDAFAVHPDGGTYWNVVWERRAKTVPKGATRWVARAAQANQFLFGYAAGFKNAVGREPG